MLSQIQDGKECVIPYISCSLSQSESRHRAHKLEILAPKWAVTDKLYDYLYGHKFPVITDNTPPTCVLTSAKLDATGHRWLVELAAYDFSIKYRPGVQNTVTDALSRLPSRRQTDTTQAPPERFVGKASRTENIGK